MTPGGYNIKVKSVGIKVLKARLSEYVRLATGGTRILVTERDQVVAEPVPAYHTTPPPHDSETLLLRLAESGEASLRSAEIDPANLKIPLSKKIKLSASNILDDLRSE